MAGVDVPVMLFIRAVSVGRSAIVNGYRPTAVVLPWKINALQVLSWQIKTEVLTTSRSVLPCHDY